jgi:hypothetical protein
MLAKANRERLAVLLEESRGGAGSDERYAASLRWVSHLGRVASMCSCAWPQNCVHVQLDGRPCSAIMYQMSLHGSMIVKLIVSES